MLRKATTRSTGLLVAWGRTCRTLTGSLTATYTPRSTTATCSSVRSSMSSTRRSTSPAVCVWTIRTPSVRRSSMLLPLVSSLSLWATTPQTTATSSRSMWTSWRTTIQPLAKISTSLVPLVLPMKSTTPRARASEVTSRSSLISSSSRTPTPYRAVVRRAQAVRATSLSSLLLNLHGAVRSSSPSRDVRTSLRSSSTV